MNNRAKLYNLNTGYIVHLKEPHTVKTATRIEINRHEEERYSDVTIPEGYYKFICYGVKRDPNCWYAPIDQYDIIKKNTKDLIYIDYFRSDTYDSGIPIDKFEIDEYCEDLNKDILQEQLNDKRCASLNRIAGGCNNIAEATKEVAEATNNVAMAIACCGMGGNDELTIRGNVHVF